MIKEAKYKGYHILIEDDNSVKLLLSKKSLTPVKPKLRKIAEEINFETMESWNTQTLGSKLVDYLNLPGIVINRMYVGDYLSSNLGHEVINMYTADNEKHYLYLNAYGSFAEKWQGKIGYMLLTKYHAKNCVEVLGKAVGLSDIYNYKEDESNKKGRKISSHQERYIKDEKITYGGVPLTELFSHEERQSVYITFKADKVFKLKEKKSIFIYYNPQGENQEEKNNQNENLQALNELKQEKPRIIQEDGKIVIHLEESKLALASLDQFFIPENGDYQELFKLINSDKYKDYWVELGDNDKINLSDTYEPRNKSLFDICKIQNDENCFSNALAYFIEQDKYVDLWYTFFVNYLNADIILSNDYWIKREEDAKITDNDYKNKNKVEGGGRIDIIIRDSNNVIVIENKIKSDINKNASDKKKLNVSDRNADNQSKSERNQLHRYKEYVEWRISDKDKGKTPYYCILTPNYNQPEIPVNLKSEKGIHGYKIITYKDLYEFLGSKEEIWQDDSNMRAFYEAIYRHTHKNVNDYLYYEMQEKLMYRIYEYHKRNPQS